MSAALIGNLWARQVEYAAEGFRDPFQKELKETRGSVSEEQKLGEEQPLPSLAVQAMVWGGDLPQAIINNKVVKEGDIIEGVKIVKIEKSGVTILHRERQYQLSSPAAINLKSLEEKSEGGRNESQF